MSLTKKDRKVQSNCGKEFPVRDDYTGVAFAQVIADALHRDFGGTHAAVKSVAARTKSNERAVKNWFNAKNGPTGQNLVDLIGISDEVLEAVLFLCGREELVINNRLLCSREILIRMLELIGGVQQVSAQLPKSPVQPDLDMPPLSQTRKSAYPVSTSAFERPLACRKSPAPHRNSQ